MAGGYQKGFDGPAQEPGDEEDDYVDDEGSHVMPRDVELAPTGSSREAGTMSPAGAAFSVFKEEIGKAAELWRTVQGRGTGGGGAGGGPLGGGACKRPQSRSQQLRQQQDSQHAAQQHQHEMLFPPDVPGPAPGLIPQPGGSLPPLPPREGAAPLRENGLSPHHPLDAGMAPAAYAVPPGHRSKLSVDLEQLEQERQREQQRQEEQDGEGNFEDVNELLLTPGQARLGGTVLDLEQQRMQQQQQQQHSHLSPGGGKKPWDPSGAQAVYLFGERAKGWWGHASGRFSQAGPQEGAFRVGLLILGVLVATAVALMLVFLTRGSAATPPVYPLSDDGVLRLNEVQLLGSRQSYHVAPDPAILAWLGTTQYREMAQALNFTHPPLYAQLEAGYRYIHLDVYYDPAKGLFQKPAVLAFVNQSLPSMPADIRMPGFKVLNMPDLDFGTTCVTLPDCLQDVVRFSREHPGHVPILVRLNFKSAKVAVDELLPAAVDPRLPDAEALLALEADILRVVERSRIITPDSVRGDKATLLEAIQAGADSGGGLGWPTLESAAGKLLFLLTPLQAVQDYSLLTPALQGRLMFTARQAVTKANLPFSPDQAVLVMEAFDDSVADLVASGHLVVSPLLSIRTDLEAYLWSKSLSSGCQVIAVTDLSNDPGLAAAAHNGTFPPPAPSDSEPSESPEGGLVIPLVAQGPGPQVQCNAVLDPTSCSLDRWKRIMEPVPQVSMGI